MKNINQFLTHLNGLGVKLWLDESKTDGDITPRLRYSAPKGTMNSALLTELKEHKADIIQFLQQANQSKDSTYQPIQPAPRDGNLPLSFAQQRLWFLEQLEDSTSTYNWPRTLHFKGSLNIAILEQSISEIVRRHEVLRTTFSEIDGTPVQKIREPESMKISVLDLQDLPEEKKLEEARYLATKEQNQPFNLANDLLIRVVLLRLEPEEHFLVLTLHHIVADGWFMSIFLGELTTLYQAFSEDKPSHLPELPIQYADFAYWQRQHFQGEVLQRQVSYWKQQLAGVPPLLELPSDRPRPTIQTFSGRTEWIFLNKDLRQKLKTLTQQSGVTLFMTLLTAFATLLYRYTGQSDFVIGSPIANRNRSEIEGLIGFFVNTLALRIKIEPNSTWQELLTQVRQVALDAYEHQNLPFEKLVEELQLERNLSYSPLFQTLFVLQNSPQGELKLPGLKVTELEPENVTAKFDLSLEMVELEEELAAGFEYNTDLFDTATIKRMAGHFQTLLEGIVANPDQKVDRLPLITPTEKDRLLHEWNNTQIGYPNDLCIHELFEAQVTKTPHAVAVKFNDRELTYAELNQKANRLAHYLQTLGVKPNTLVGICLERSFEMIIGLLAILKIGGAYVPFDSAYPTERLSFMLDDTQLSILLSQEHLLAKLPTHQAKVVCLDRDREKIRQESPENLTSEVKADNLAYVMYTSGSTGKPKGVQVIHRGVVRLVKHTSYINLSAEEIFLQLAPISFDASTFEIWGSLLNGGQLILFPGNTPSLPELGQIIKQEQITTLWLTAGLFHLMVDERLEDLTYLRQLLAGGDVLSVPHVQRFLTKVGANGRSPLLINGYGPTENTTFTCCYEITQATDFNNSIPIGRPINNTQVYILDNQLQPVPVGVPGELYIGGDGLARGYLNRDDLTEEKFISNPFQSGGAEVQRCGGETTTNSSPAPLLPCPPTPLLYKTGDLVRYLPDGNIEFIGRIDNQVKIRGFRIELGEIEAMLAQHPGVRENVVLAREDVPGDKHLVAYILPDRNQQLTTAELRSFLQDKLPNYMMPGIFVMVSEMPLTANGKIDRRALPATDLTDSQREVTFVAPRDAIEIRLTKIWSKIFGIKQIGLRDNFFELGGHSLLAVRLFAAIEKSFKQRIPLAKIFEAPTIEQLAEILRQEGVSTQHSSVVSIQPQGHKSPFFCVHSGYGEILLYQNLGFRLDPDRPVYGLLAKGVDGNIAPVTDIEAMASYYVEEIQAIQPEGPYFLGGVCIGGTIALEMARQLQAKGENVPVVAVFGTIPLHLLQSPSIQSQPLTKSQPTNKKLTSYLTFLAKLTLQEKVVHFVDQIHEKIQHWLYLCRQIIEPYQYRFYRQRGKPLSQDLQRFYIYQVNREAQNNFEQKVFDGELISFWASLDRRFSLAQQMYWATIATGGVKLYDLPEEHIERALNGPSIQNIVEFLRQNLDNAETNIHSTQTKDREEGDRQGIISQFQQPKSWSSLIPIQTNGLKPPLFCIHGSDGVNCGEPLYGYELARNLKSTQPIYGLRAVGLDGQNSPLNSIEAMATKYLEEIRAVYPSGSYLLLGLDLGGLIAFEMAQQLSAQREQLPLLAMINTLAPNSDSLLANSFTNLPAKFNELKQSIEKLNQETKCQFIRNFKQNSLPNNLRYFLIQESLIQAQQKYEAKLYKNNLTLFRSEDINSSLSIDLGWKNYVNNDLEIYALKGNYKNIFKEPNIQYFSRKIEDCIEKYLEENS